MQIKGLLPIRHQLVEIIAFLAFVSFIGEETIACMSCILQQSDEQSEPVLIPRHSTFRH